MVFVFFWQFDLEYWFDQLFTFKILIVKEMTHFEIKKKKIYKELFVVITVMGKILINNCLSYALSIFVGVLLFYSHAELCPPPIYYLLSV